MTPKMRIGVLSLVSVALVSLDHSLGAFNLDDGRWDPGPIDVEMQLGSASGLMDGSTDWDECAIASLVEWNGVLSPAGVNFNAIRGSTRTPASGDSVNSVLFSNDIYGTPFGEQILAVTTSRFFIPKADVDQYVEADVLFNSAQEFNCYRGARQLGPVPESPPNVTDLRRVATHEFGHMLGLLHPDDIGQAVLAIMNAFISDIDVLQLDDIQGLLTLYGLSVVGIPFPPRDQVLDFFLSLENEYRDTLGRPQNRPGNVNAEGSALWFPEWLRYVLNGCSATEASDRVLLQIRGQGIQPVCGVVPPGVINFPPRNLSLDFLVILDEFYRDVLNENAPDSYIDREGKAVWLQEYLRYRVNGCNNQEATDRVFQQIRGGGIAPICAA